MWNTTLGILVELTVVKDIGAEHELLIFPRNCIGYWTIRSLIIYLILSMWLEFHRFTIRLKVTYLACAVLLMIPLISLWHMRDWWRLNFWAPLTEPLTRHRWAPVNRTAYVIPLLITKPDDVPRVSGRTLWCSWSV